MRLDSATLTPLSRQTPMAGGGNNRLPMCLLTMLFVALLGMLYWTILRDLVSQWWDDPNYSHGFVVPFVSGFIVWQRRKELAAIPPRGSWIGLAVLMIGVVELIWGDIGSDFFLLRSSLIIIVSGLILFPLGPRVLRVLPFPLAFLFFMTPLPAVLFYAA